MSRRHLGPVRGGRERTRGEDHLPGVLLSTIKPERVRWLWEPRLPQGKLVILEGDPDEGKTTLMLDLAARVSTGAPMPLSTATRRPRGVVVLSAEDGLGDTIVPRLLAARADLSRIVSERFERWPSLDAHGLDQIRQLIVRVRARLVILDPVTAFIPDYTNTYSDHRIRRLLAPLKALAEETKATIVLLRHLTKPVAGAARSPKYAGGGSIAFTGAARATLLAATDPRDPSLHVLARVKGNLAPPFPALGYRTVESADDPDIVVIEWLGETTHTAAELLAVDATRGDTDDTDDHSALARVGAWLRARFAERASWGATEITLAASEANISKRTLDRAKAVLGVRSEKRGARDGVGAWRWVLPSVSDDASAGGGQGCQPRTTENLGNLGSLDPSQAESSTAPTTNAQTTKAAKDAKDANISRSTELARLVRVRVANCPGFSRCPEYLTDDEYLRRLWRAHTGSQSTSLPPYKAAARRVTARRR